MQVDRAELAAEQMELVEMLRHNSGAGLAVAGVPQVPVPDGEPSVVGSRASGGAYMGWDSSQAEGDVPAIDHWDGDKQPLSLSADGGTELLDTLRPQPSADVPLGVEHQSSPPAAPPRSASSS